MNIGMNKNQVNMLIYYKRLSGCALYSGSIIRSYAKSSDNEKTPHETRENQESKNAINQETSTDPINTQIDTDNNITSSDTDQNQTPQSTSTSKSKKKYSNKAKIITDTNTYDNLTSDTSTENDNLTSSDTSTKNDNITSGDTSTENDNLTSSDTSTSNKKKRKKRIKSSETPISTSKNNKISSDTNTENHSNKSSKIEPDLTFDRIRFYLIYFIRNIILLILYLLLIKNDFCLYCGL